MTLFSFPELHVTLLERIIPKLKPISYFRLQQTCRDMEDLIRTNKNIKVLVNASCELTYEKPKKKKKNQKRQFPCKLTWNRKYFTATADSLYGVRFKNFYPYIQSNFEDYCEFLKHYRMTSVNMPIYLATNGIELTEDQCGTLYKILKPLKVELKSYGSNRWEALLSIKHLKDVYVWIDSNESISVMKKLIVNIPTVQIFARHLNQETSETELDEIMSILQFFRSSPLPNLHHFLLTKSWFRNVTPSVVELLKKFRDFAPILSRKSQKGKPVLICWIRTNGPSCTVAINERFWEIEYQVNCD